MTQNEQILFNLLVNSALSFIVGLALVACVLRVFRVEAGRWKILLLSLPFLKILWDIAQGVPASSVVFSGLDPLAVPPKHSSLLLGAGFSEYGPIINLVFFSEDGLGNAYSTSVADYFASWLMRTVSPVAPSLILAAFVWIAVLLLLRRLIHSVRFEIQRRRSRAAAHPLPPRFAGGRRVDVYVAPLEAGTPYTGGILRPYICLPEDAFEALTDAEREAVIRHEIAHVRSFDLPVTIAVKVLGDIFWFVPLYRVLSRKIDRLREIIADRTAVRSGVSSVHLASALVRLKEMAATSAEAMLYSAFFRERALLRERVERLLDPTSDPRSRFGWNLRWVRPLIAFWTVGAVCAATIGGNHASRLGPLPPWAERLLESVSP